LETLINGAVKRQYQLVAHIVTTMLSQKTYHYTDTSILFSLSIQLLKKTSAA